MRKFLSYVLCGVMAVAFSPAIGQSSDGRKNDPQVKRQAKKQEDAKREDTKQEDTNKAERPAAAGGSVKKEDIDDDGKNRKEKD